MSFFFLSCNSSSFHEVLFFLVACTYQNENSLFCCVEDKITMQPFYSYLEEETTMQAWFVRKEEEEMQCNTSFFLFGCACYNTSLLHWRSTKEENVFSSSSSCNVKPIFILFLKCVLCTMWAFKKTFLCTFVAWKKCLLACFFFLLQQ